MAAIIQAVLLGEIADDTDIPLGNLIGPLFTQITKSNHAISNFMFNYKTESPTRITGYFDEVVPHYSEIEFRSHFRMTKSSFETLLCLLAPYVPERSVQLEKKLLASLWLLGTQECWSVADRFGFSKSTLHDIFMMIVKALVTIQREFIVWPATPDELRSVADGFAKRCGFPGVVGAVDGTHIPIPGPSEHRDSYINRKGFPSIYLQAVCDSSLVFRDVHAGWPGSVHDARVWRNSPLYKEIPSLSHDYHILGDSAYPLSTNVLVPFRDNGHLSSIEKKFNKCHSSTRVDIERAFGLLKCKFRRLRFLDMHLISEIPTVIVACCVLHNYILQKESFEEDDVAITTDDVSTQMSDAAVVGHAAITKRMEIANMLA